MSWIWPEHLNRDLPPTKQERRAIHHDAWKLWWANRWNIALYLTLPGMRNVAQTDPDAYPAIQIDMDADERSYQKNGET